MSQEYAVVVTFPSAPSAYAEHSIRVKAVDVATAVSRAIKQARWQMRRKTKHRGITDVGRVSWQLIEPADNSDKETANASSQA